MRGIGRRGVRLDFSPGIVFHAVEIESEKRDWGDIDGDGKDEVFVSAQDTGCFYMIDHDETLLRKIHIPTEIGKDTHVDFLVVADVDEDGKPELVTSTGFALFEANGKRRWTLTEKNPDAEHGQWVQTGKIRKDVPGQQILFLDAKGGLKPSPLLLASAQGEILWKFEKFRTTVYGAGFIDRQGTGEYEIYVCEQGRRDCMLGFENVYWDKNRQMPGTPVSFDIVMISSRGEETDRLSFVDHGGPGAYEGIWGGVSAQTVAKLDRDSKQSLAVLTFDGRLLLIR